MSIMHDDSDGLIVCVLVLLLGFITGGVLAATLVGNTRDQMVDGGEYIIGNTVYECRKAYVLDDAGNKYSVDNGVEE